MLPDLATLYAAAEQVHRVVAPTPQLHWPLLSARCGAEVWVKHENCAPTGAFKVRGGLLYLDALRRQEPDVTGVVAATRGNHGQSIGFAAGRLGVEATIVVPHGNSREKNTAMRGYGATLIERGRDFSEALEFAGTLAAERGLHLVPSFHPLLLRGVASYGLELLRGVPDLDAIYVPIGLGSGICGTIAARDALGLRTHVIGVVAAGAPAYRLSFERGEPVATESADTLADGVAVRVPHPDAVAIVNRGAERIVAVDDAEIRAAMRHHFTDTHHVAEGAGAAALAALLQEHEAMAGRRVAVVQSGGNVDRDVFARVLDEAGPGHAETGAPEGPRQP